MPDLIPGQLLRLVDVQLPGEDRPTLAAEVYVGEDADPVLGRLLAPPNGSEGGIVFRPEPGYRIVEDEQPAAPAPPPAPGGGTLTTGDVPVRGRAAANPDDPRGLRGGRRR